MEKIEFTDKEGNQIEILISQPESGKLQMLVLSRQNLLLRYHTEIIHHE